MKLWRLQKTHSRREEHVWRGGAVEGGSLVAAVVTWESLEVKSQT